MTAEDNHGDKAEMMVIMVGDKELLLGRLNGLVLG